MKQKNTIVKNASFLMVCLLVAKIIGLLYKSPLSNILGNVGASYYGLAQNAYFILLMISSFSIPQAVSKLVSERIIFKQYRNAQKMFRGALMYAAIVGGVAALVCFFGASILIPSKQPDARLALQVLAPTIFLSGILGVFRGYFQAFSNMVPTSLSQIIEQVANASVGILMAWVFIHQVAGSDESSRAKWGAAGGTLGTGAGVAVALLFMLLVYQANRSSIRKRLLWDRTRKTETYREILKTLLLIATPIIFSAFIYNVNGYINGYMFNQLAVGNGMSSKEVASVYTQYSIYFMTIINIPLTLCSAAPTSMIPEVSACYAKRDMKGVRKNVDQTMQFSMYLSIPAAVGLSVLAQPITKILYANSTNVAVILLMFGAFTVILNGISNVSNGVLQGIGKPNIPMRNAAVCLVIDIGVLLALLLTTDLGIYSVLVAMSLYAVIMCILNQISMRKILGYKNKWRENFLVPFLSAVPMGIAASGIYYGLYALVSSRILCLAFAVLAAAAVYGLFLLLLAKPKEKDILRMPAGGLILKVTKALHLVKK